MCLPFMDSKWYNITLTKCHVYYTVCDWYMRRVYTCIYLARDKRPWHRGKCQPISSILTRARYQSPSNRHFMRWRAWQALIWLPAGVGVGAGACEGPLAPCSVPTPDLPSAAGRATPCPAHLGPVARGHASHGGRGYIRGLHPPLYTRYMHNCGRLFFGV